MCKKNSNLDFNFLKNFVLNCLNHLDSQEIMCIDIDKKYSFTDLMIICTGQSCQHVKSIAQNLSEKLKTINFNFYRVEGLQDGQWILIDLEDIIVHIMQQNIRTFYALEKLWVEN